ncbi:IMV membrane protein virion maturation [NY_014 poxvirus]|uniref:IMV membrane protein virion maturation n=1 Tax=NY_014 poxvirus TaxID=2025360 RepID=UPI000B99F718|nr:IMV membrane protein virion maturation [NY_014 poxvirus]AST09525.1 IMV membrane protein virion maturation [NY_014 poxvirus]
MIGNIILIVLCVVVVGGIIYALYHRTQKQPNPPPNNDMKTKYVNSLGKEHISSLYNLFKSSS